MLREGQMLSEYAIHPSLATANVDKARGWYAERLGLEPLLVFPSLLVYQVEQSIFTVFETPAARTAKNTVAIWRVPDLRAEITRLRARRVEFEDLDFGGDERTIDGIMTSADLFGGIGLRGWVPDGADNPIGMGARPPHPRDPAAGQGNCGSAAACRSSR